MPIFTPSAPTSCWSLRELIVCSATLSRVPGFDLSCESLQLTSIHVLNFPSRDRSKMGQFKVGIVDENFDSAKEWAASLGYDGPFVLAVDDTKLVPALRSYDNAGTWTLVGMHGRVETFESYDELVAKGQEITKEMLAEKVSILNI
jgi:D-arabinose 1-dehydrogenase-like Zn-dependent alcohol dehydrogenase